MKLTYYLPGCEMNHTLCGFFSKGKKYYKIPHYFLSQQLLSYSIFNLLCVKLDY